MILEKQHSTAEHGYLKIPCKLRQSGPLTKLNAYIGYARTMIDDTDIAALLIQIQNHLFSLGADLATPESHSKSEDIRISSEFTTDMETAIDTLTDELPPLTNFILPGGCHAASIIHVARAVCRRSERCVVRLTRETEINPEIIRCLNRLSDLLFVLARVVNHRAQVEEPIWKS